MEEGERDGGPLRRWLRSLRPQRHTLAPEALAGLPGAIGSVPDGMAAAVLAGVNPIYGLYASMAGPIVGGLFASTALVVVTTTSAAALAAGSALTGVSSADRADALFLMTVIAGIAMALAGILRFARYTRFVANSVMVGFITGIAVNMILSQFPDVTGAPADGSTPLARAIDVVLHPAGIDPATVIVALAAFAILVLASRTKVKPIAALIALVIPSIAVAVFGLDQVETVSSLGSIPTGIPAPSLPQLNLINFDLVAGALAVAVIVLVQGSGVSEAVPNPDGSRSDGNRDFLAQGLANVASGLFQGQPVGASVGQTALNMAAGARSRWASIFSGLWMLLILLVFSPLVGRVAMATLGSVLIFAALGAIKPQGIALTLHTGSTSQIAVVTTFVATLLLPVAVAVGIGVALSLLLQVNREALDLTVVSLLPQGDGSMHVGPVPQRLADRSVTILDVYGSLQFAGARTLELRLPDPTGVVAPAIVLRLRGRTTLTSTAISVLSRYGERLEAVGGRLYLSGVDPKLAEDLSQTLRLEAVGPMELVEATDVLGESSIEASRRAQAFVARGGSSR